MLHLSSCFRIFAFVYTVASTNCELSVCRLVVFGNWEFGVKVWFFQIFCFCVQYFWRLYFYLLISPNFYGTYLCELLFISRNAWTSWFIYAHRIAVLFLFLPLILNKFQFSNFISFLRMFANFIWITCWSCDFYFTFILHEEQRWCLIVLNKTKNNIFNDI